jgi:predicted nucleic acid-binding Zn ribbon protein
MGLNDMKEVLESILEQIKILNKETNRTRKIISVVNFVNILTIIALIMVFILK